MWPWGHVAVGYLLFSMAAHTRYARTPTPAETAVIAIATLLPDLIDKPLAWTVPILPNGRSLGHSLFTAILFIAIVQWLWRNRQGGAVGLAFAVGYLSHLGADGLYPALNGEFYYLGFMAYPVLPPVAYADESTSIFQHFLEFQLTPFAAIEIALTVFAFGLWIRHGCPGTGPVATAIDRHVD